MRGRYWLRFDNKNQGCKCGRGFLVGFCCGLLLLSVLSDRGRRSRLFSSIFQCLLRLFCSLQLQSCSQVLFASINLQFGFPRFLLFGTLIAMFLFSNVVVFPTQTVTIPSYSCFPQFILSTCVVPLMYSFLISSIFVKLIEKRSIFNSATFSSASCFLVSNTVSRPSTIAGLITDLYSFYFTLADTSLSHITAVTFLHPFRTAITLFFISHPWFSFLCTVDPKYLSSVTLVSSTSRNFALLSSLFLFMYKYAVLLRLTFISLLSNLMPLSIFQVLRLMRAYDFRKYSGLNLSRHSAAWVS